MGEEIQAAASMGADDLDFFDEIDTWFDALQARSTPRPDNSITIREYMERYGVAENTARRHLDKFVRQGKMYRDTAWIDGKRFRVFVRVEDKDAEEIA